MFDQDFWIRQLRSQKIINVFKQPALPPLIFNSNWVSRLFFFGPDKIGIEKMRSIFFKDEKGAAFQLRSHTGCGGETNYFKSTGIPKKCLANERMFLINPFRLHLLFQNQLCK